MLFVFAWQLGFEYASQSNFFLLIPTFLHSTLQVFGISNLQIITHAVSSAWKTSHWIGFVNSGLNVRSQLRCNFPGEASLPH